MTHLVVGMGQIGTAVHKVLGERYEAVGIDKGQSAEGQFDMMHVCIPHTEEFCDTVVSYQCAYKPRIVVVHSTVPVGTCDPNGWCHSPVRGIHPNLYEGVKTFKKFFGGSGAAEAATTFRECGLKTYVCELAKTTEAMKLWDTTIYGVNIALEKELYEFCEKHSLPFDEVYTIPNQTYNEGYEKLGHPEYVKYVLKHVEGPIGGHCVVPNCHLLGGEAAQYVLDKNK